MDDRRMRLKRCSAEFVLRIESLVTVDCSFLRENAEFGP